MKRSHKIRLYPNNKQATLLSKHFGVARFTYNTCLDKWNKDYQQGIKHNYFSMNKWFNSIKNVAYPFVKETSKWCCNAAIQDLDKAFKNMFAKRGEHPKFHKKGINDAFRIDGSDIKIIENKLKLPKGLVITMAEKIRWNPIKIYNVTISRKAERWFASFNMEILESENQTKSKVSGEMIGVDLGIKTLMTLSNGETFDNPKYEKMFRQRIARLQRSLARKQLRSKNWYKAKRNLANTYWHLSNVRLDYIHKATTSIVKKYKIVALEKLNVSGMLKNPKLSRSISDASFYEIKRQFSYKAQEMMYVDTFYPSSQLCSACGVKNPEVKNLRVRKWRCPDCGAEHDRDVNAAMNILAGATREVKPMDRRVAGRSRNHTTNGDLYKL